MKSRLAVVPFLLLAPEAPAAAQQPIALSADDAARLERAMHRRHPTGCVADEIGQVVVCGRREKRMEFEREPGEIVRHINEPGLGVDALAADRCTRLCNVGVRVNLIQAAQAIPKIARHILGRD